MNQGTTSKTYYRKRIPVKHSYSSYVNTFGDKAYYWSNALYMIKRNPSDEQAKSILSGLQLSSRKLLDEFLALREDLWRSSASRFEYDSMYRMPGCYTANGQEWDFTLTKDGKIIQIGTELKDEITWRSIPEGFNFEELFLALPNLDCYKV